MLGVAVVLGWDAATANEGDGQDTMRLAQQVDLPYLLPPPFAELSGVPVMRLQIRNAVEQARLVYNTVGLAAGCLIALAFFRRASFMIVAALPPLAAILFGLGALGWLNFSLNILLNMMAPLIMVISFSDSMQLTLRRATGSLPANPYVRRTAAPSW